MNKAQFMAENLRSGEVYAGILLGMEGEPDQHIFLLPGEADKITYPDAAKWAQEAGGELPTRREQALLFANLKKEFEGAYYWSGEAHEFAENGYCYTNFYTGRQSYQHKSDACCARAVRRLVI